ncbi:MAG: Gfo/Idh/MocA family oxidoreductase, partial [Acidobacteria bacterium]|nr:Gfo/Idh/MocA family oxidoreductase [Acidobacteriota bacterium]
MLLRREFLAAPAAAMAQSPRKVKVAFLGASHAHGVAKLEMVKNSPDYELAGVWEEDAAARARLGRLGELRWRTKAEILGDRSVEAVFLEGPVVSHGPLAIEALEAGKHCHIEKPAADTVAQMKQIVTLAKARRRVIQAGYMWRYNPAVTKALEAVKKGWLGEVFSVHVRINTNNGPGERVELGKFAGGQMFEMGAHGVDIVVRMLGTPRRITPFLRHDGAFQDSFQDNTAAVLEYPKAMAVIVTSALHPNGAAHRVLEIFGTNGSAVVQP